MPVALVIVTMPALNEQTPDTAIATGPPGAVAERENVALNVGAGEPPTISVPTRSQSGSRNSSRVQLWRSVAPAGNGVPGKTIGLGYFTNPTLNLERTVAIEVPTDNPAFKVAIVMQ